MTMEKLFGRRAAPDDEHWMSVSDLMAGLMVIFLFIAITYIRPIVEIQSKIVTGGRWVIMRRTLKFLQEHGFP